MSVPEQKGVDTILGDDTVFVGKIESRGTLRVDGRVEGEIVAQDTIIIGPSGVVKADIRSATLSVSGQVDGNIKASQKIEFHPTATVNGDVQTAIGALTVEPGAKINGNIIMTDERADAARQRPAAQGAAPSGAQPAAQGGAQRPPSPGAPSSAQQQIRLDEGRGAGAQGGGAAQQGAGGTPPNQRKK